MKRLASRRKAHSAKQQQGPPMHATRPRGRPRQSALDQRMLEATLRLLAEVGFTHMSMDDVARAAQTTRATIYLRYRSKAALTAAAIVYARRSFSLPPATGELRADLVAQLRHFQASLAAPYSLPIIGTLLAEGNTLPELRAAIRENVVATRRQALKAILQTAQARHELAPEADLNLAAAQCIGSYYALAIAGEPIPPDWPERVVRQVLAGIQPGAQPREQHFQPE